MYMFMRGALVLTKQKLISRHFWWPGIKQYVKDRVRNCDCCQRNQPRNMPSAGKLMPLPIPGHKWACVTMDFITDLPVSNTGYDAVLVFVDKLTKMVHLCPTTNTCSATELATLFIKDIYRPPAGCMAFHKALSTTEGQCSYFLREGCYTWISNFYTKVCSALGIQQLPSSAYHPQTDGQTERVDRVLEDTLRHYINDEQTNWDALLPLVEFAINNSQHASTKFTPFYLNYGCNPATPLSVQVPVAHKEVENTGAPAVTKFVADMQSALGQATQHLNVAQDRMKHYADQKRIPDPEYQVGHEVLLSTKNIPLKHPGSTKLLPQWVGPFKVLKRVSAVAYKQQLPDNMSRLHSVFHSSLLKPYDKGAAYQPPPPVLLEDGSLEFEVEALLDYRERRLPNSARVAPEYLVKWHVYSHEHNTWEPVAHLTNSDELLQAYKDAHREISTKAVPGTRRRSKRARRRAGDR